MSANHFSFKQFTIQQELCAMKVGTDGVLLGAWADVKSTSLQVHKSTSILDVGTGTGLIALMAAQRNPEAHIIAIDVNPDAVRQAQENVGASPFANRIIVRQTDFRKGVEGHFDAILCNPPYFENALRCPDASRSTARHSDTLSFDDLALNASSLLRPLGTLSVIIPSERRMDMIAACATQGLTLVRETHVRTLPTKPPKRILLEFISGLVGQQERLDYPEFPKISTLTIEATPGVPTPEFKALLKEFYLKF
jgi:tRNA1Val (adenine37-N6)-methyltransferase